MVEKRRQAILKELDKKEKVRVAELSRELNCSEVTIRNDIRTLEQEGLLKRTHGGAERIGGAPQSERRYPSESVYRNISQKRAIAARAYSLIDDRDTIILDDASTSFYLALHIKEHPEKQLAVVTNSLPIGSELADVKHVELYMVGGHVGGKLPATMGDAAVENLKNFHVDKAFIGVHSINFNVGLTSIATPQMQVKRAIIDASQKVCVLADSTKFGSGYVSVIGPINEVDAIITDSGIEGQYVEMAAQEGVDLIIA